MLTWTAAATFLRSPIARGIGLSIGVAIAALYGYRTIHASGVAACKSDAQLDQIHAKEEAHQELLAEVARGDAISAELSKTQRRLNETKSEYLTYAHAIVGVCDPSVRMLVEYASGAKDPVPEAPGAPADGAFAESAVHRAYEEAVARAMGENIAENFSRLDLCIAEKRALNAWHAGPENAVTNPGGIAR